jgi:hypothetical protein
MANSCCGSPPFVSTMIKYGLWTETETPPAGDFLLLETGDYILLETGDKIILE